MKAVTTHPRVFASSPAAFGALGCHSRNWARLGQLAEAGPFTDVRFDTASANVVGILGTRGSGKSYMPGMLLEGLCTRDYASSMAFKTCTQAVFLFDMLGNLQRADIALDEKNSRSLI